MYYGSLLGTAVFGAPGLDFNNDGFDDVMLGSSLAGFDDEGSVQILYGFGSRGTVSVAR